MKKEILKATLLAGTLDILAAFAHGFMAGKTMPDTVLRYIASGLFGKTAFSDGIIYPLLGLLFHFLIVFICTVTYFKLYPRLKIVQKNVFFSAFIIALVAWVVTTRVIIPLSRISPAPFNVNKAIIAIGILLFCVGLPVAFLRRNFLKGPDLSFLTNSFQNKRDDRF